jgi:adenosine deaminase
MRPRRAAAAVLLPLLLARTLVPAVAAPDHTRPSQSPPSSTSTAATARADDAAAAATAALRALVASLPKAELHLHIEGTLEVELMMRLAKRNNVSLPYKTADEARRARQSYASLQPFLDAYRVAMRTLRTREDFRELTAAYLKRAAQNNVRRAEIFVDLQTHLKSGVKQRDVVGGIEDALKAAAQPDHQPRPVDAALILCFVRDFGPLAAVKAAAAAAPYFSNFIGVGLASAEVGNPPGPFWPVFRAAQAVGKHRVAHAGEEGGPEYVWGALRALKVERVDHGVRSLEDPKLIARLRETGVPLTVCPLSNRALKVYDGQLQQRMKELFLESGVVVTVNSDDPAYFGGGGGGGGGGTTSSISGGGGGAEGEEREDDAEEQEEEEDGYVNSNYSYLARSIGLGPRDLLRLAQASFNASFWGAESKRRGVEEAERAWRAWDEGAHGQAWRAAMARTMVWR